VDRDNTPASTSLHPIPPVRRGCSSFCRDWADCFTWRPSYSPVTTGRTNFLSRGHSHVQGACASSMGMPPCRISSQRPYVCPNPGLPLRWIDSGTGSRRASRYLSAQRCGEPIAHLGRRGMLDAGPVSRTSRAASLAAGAESTRIVPSANLFAANDGACPRFFCHRPPPLSAESIKTTSDGPRARTGRASQTQDRKPRPNLPCCENPHGYKSPMAKEQGKKQDTADKSEEGSRRRHCELRDRRPSKEGASKLPRAGSLGPILASSLLLELYAGSVVTVCPRLGTTP